jgi:hypothetical protein
MRKEIKIFKIKLTPLKKPQLTLKTISKKEFKNWEKLKKIRFEITIDKKKDFYFRFANIKIFICK